MPNTLLTFFTVNYKTRNGYVKFTALGIVCQGLLHTIYCVWLGTLFWLLKKGDDD